MRSAPSLGCNLLQRSETKVTAASFVPLLSTIKNLFNSLTAFFKPFGVHCGSLDEDLSRHTITITAITRLFLPHFHIYKLKEYHQSGQRLAPCYGVMMVATCRKRSGHLVLSCWAFMAQVQLETNILIRLPSVCVLLPQWERARYYREVVAESDSPWISLAPASAPRSLAAPCSRSQKKRCPWKKEKSNVSGRNRQSSPEGGWQRDHPLIESVHILSVCVLRVC